MTDTNTEVRVAEFDVEDEEVMPAGQWAHWVAGLVPLGLGAAMMLESLNLGLGSLTAPQAGLWPFCLSILLIALSLGLIVGRGRFGICEAFGRGALLVVAGAITIVALIVTLPIVGFEIPAVALTAFWLKVLGRETWRVTVIVPVVATAAFHLLFVELLGVPIPHLFAF